MLSILTYLSDFTFIRNNLSQKSQQKVNRSPDQLTSQLCLFAEGKPSPDGEGCNHLPAIMAQHPKRDLSVMAVCDHCWTLPGSLPWSNSLPHMSAVRRRGVQPAAEAKYHSPDGISSTCGALPSSNKSPAKPVYHLHSENKLNETCLRFCLCSCWY